jgi:hypothetical protein
MARSAKAPKLATSFKSKPEEEVAKQLDDAGIAYEYEGRPLSFEVPSRIAKYKGDFPIVGSPIILEVKGRFGHRGNDGAGAKVRQHLILAKQQNPASDIRIVFQNAKNKIRKGSETTYAKWAEDHGFKWADKGIVPASWIKEMKK